MLAGNVVIDKGSAALLRQRFTTPPSVLPDISPTRGEIDCHAGFRQSSTLQE